MSALGHALVHACRCALHIPACRLWQLPAGHVLSLYVVVVVVWGKAVDACQASPDDNVAVTRMRAVWIWRICLAQRHSHRRLP